MGFRIEALDHFVLTVADIDATCAFYSRALGCEVITFGEGRKALGFGRQKMNLHPVRNAFQPRAATPTPGSADLCFLTSTPIDAVVRHLEECGIAIIDGPLERTGAMGPIMSVYVRDPDGNLVEVSNQL